MTQSYNTSEQAFNHDVSVIAAIRWYVNQIENLALERYMGNSNNYQRIKAILDAAVDDLQRVPTVEGRDKEAEWPEVKAFGFSVWEHCWDCTYRPKC